MHESSRVGGVVGDLATHSSGSESCIKSESDMMDSSMNDSMGDEMSVSDEGYVFSRVEMVDGR